MTKRFILNHAPFVMASLRPRIAEVQVDDLCDFIWQPEAAELGGIGVQNANVGKFSPPHAIRGEAPKFSRPFDPKKVRIGLPHSLLNQKCSLARADFNLEWIRRRRKKNSRIKWAGIVCGQVRLIDADMSDIKNFSASGVHENNFQSREPRSR